MVAAWRRSSARARARARPGGDPQRRCAAGRAPRRSPAAGRPRARSGAAATMATTVLEDPSGYGRVVRDADGAVERVVETKPEGDSTRGERADTRGQHGHLRVRGAAPCAEALPGLSADNAQGELYLPQVLDLLRADGARVAAHVVEDERAGARRQRPRGARARAQARAGRDPRAPHARRREHRRSRRHGDRRGRPDRRRHRDRAVHDDRGAHARSGADCLRPALLPGGLRARGRRRASGPSPTCAPARVLRAGAKVGTFVEVKNSDIGAGAKVPHLSYIGDADVGEGTNLGRGHDHRQLRRPRQAPHDDRQPRAHRAWTPRSWRRWRSATTPTPAAGSVITEDVPAGSARRSRARAR